MAWMELGGCQVIMVAAGAALHNAGRRNLRQVCQLPWVGCGEQCSCEGEASSGSSCAAHCRRLGKPPQRQQKQQKKKVRCSSSSRSSSTGQQQLG